MQDVKAAVHRVGGVTAAARVLQVDKSTLLRFCRSGRAIERTRSTLRDGLKRIKSESIGPGTVRFEHAGSKPSVEDLMAARRIFGSMIDLIDTHLATAQTAASANECASSITNGEQHNGGG